MGIKEFRERLGQVAVGDTPIALTHHGKVVGHYLPVDGRKVADADLDAWVAARERFRARWRAAQPDWRDRLHQVGLDEAGEPLGDDPRR